MAAVLAAGDDLARSMSSRRLGSRRSWIAGSFREAPEEEEEEVEWAAIERLPTYDRLRKGMMKKMLEDGKIVQEQVDVTDLGIQERKQLMESIFKIIEIDNEKFLHNIRQRIDRVGIEIPVTEVRYENLSIEGEIYVGNRALPTLFNATLNVIESILELVRLSPMKKRKIKILKHVSGILKPSRMTLLLGPPSAGKTTLLLALAGKLDKDLRASGKITYCGHELDEFIPQRTCAYISQHDLHQGEMTVRETMDFSGRCLGVGQRYDLLAELSRREKEAGLKPDPDIDAFMKATVMSGQKTSLVTDYVLKILGLEICENIMLGNEMRRGISGGQKKRVTTGEMLVGPARVILMDEISNGLDSSTTFQIIKLMKQMVHIMDVTMVISLLQPAPETYELFDDIILISEGEIIYQGPRENVLEFFEYMGFKCPQRKGVADFLQEVTSKKDQEQYWVHKENDQSYRYISESDFVVGFNSFILGQQLAAEISVPYDKSKAHPAALVKQQYGVSKKELFKACIDREWLLIKRNSFVYIFKTFQLTIMSLLTMTVFWRSTMHYGKLENGGKYLGALFFSLVNVMFNGTSEMLLTVMRLPVFYKQRDYLFFPPWAFALPIWILRIPLSFMESVIWIVLTYYTIGFAPSPTRFFRQFLAFFGVHQMALSLYRCIAAVGRTRVVSSTLGTFSLLLVFILGGFVVSKNDIKPFMIWGYYISPMMYGQNAIVMNEFLDKRWDAPNTDPKIDAPTVGKALLKSRGFYTEDYMYWVCIAALFGFSAFFNILFIVALTYLNPIGDSKGVISEDEDIDEKNASRASSSIDVATNHAPRKGMILPFQPLSLTFDHINYYVDMPKEMKSQGAQEDRLQLLRDVSGSFRPGILTALVGVSGAGKTTLMDVLAGRKTGGYIKGNINISGYPKKQETFARISGYCEQNDIHSPNVTVYESLLFSAWLRLSNDVNVKTRKMFVAEVMELVELNSIRNSLVGISGVGGLSTEQRKRLTIAVELVASPSIIFMDEPTSGLDARAAAIVMRTVRNTVDTGRTVVCTIHQPSIDIFEAFDELLLMKRGGEVIYAGPLGNQSHKLIEYFESVQGVPKIREGYNPATWVLEVTNSSLEAQLNIDFAEVYVNSSLYQRNQELIKELNIPPSGSHGLHFPTKYSQSFTSQFHACFWKHYLSYWRNPQYNAIRFFLTTIIGVLFGLVFWNKGQKLSKQQDLLNLLGGLYSSVIILGSTNATRVQPVVDTERTVFYRERASAMYSPLSYAFSQVIVETMYVVIQTTIYALILYSMIGFEWTVTKFLWFYFFTVMCYIYYTMYAMMFVALTPGVTISIIVSAFFMTLWNLFSGFLIPIPQIPIWWRWYYWGSPVAWTLYGLVTSQVGDLDSLLEVPGEGNIPIKVFLKSTFGYEYNFLPVVAAVHVLWVVLFSLVFACGIKYLNFQRR
ncbi:ABC transporter G family member 34-like [Impatiens glandulifera]|uniref:ABC transporter G family member 34-like n=1 Tax=Impatiens glandulifera TaxID=253017 RepID=UPI001FB16B23|nr:ABC transporter G family member 34-like [Impatiens glandulifera]